MLSAEPKAEADSTNRDLNYLGYLINRIILLILLLYIVLKKITTTPSQGTWIDIAMGNHALRVQPTD